MSSPEDRTDAPTINRKNRASTQLAQNSFSRPMASEARAPAGFRVSAPWYIAFAPVTKPWLRLEQAQS